jgi:peptidoglycan-associated lipoprotein
VPNNRDKRVLRFSFFCFALSLLVLGSACSSRESRTDDEPIIDSASSRASYIAPPVEESSVPAKELAAAFFPSDSAQLTPHAKQILRADSVWLKANTEAAIEIIGYCDARGTQDYNFTLGARRAEAAKQFLQAQGIAESRITTVSFGRVDESDPSRWGHNRRASFNLFYPHATTSSEAAR